MLKHPPIDAYSHFLFFTFTLSTITSLTLHKFYLAQIHTQLLVSALPNPTKNARFLGCVITYHLPYIPSLQHRHLAATFHTVEVIWIGGGIPYLMYLNYTDHDKLVCSGLTP